MKTLIKNGTLITAADTYQADLLLDGEKIRLIGDNLPAEDAQVVDAAGKLVLPGGIDVHTHLELPVGNIFTTDDFYTGHKAAAFGGTTCHIDFAHQDRGEPSLYPALERYHQKAAGKAVIDYGFHVGIADLTPQALAEIPSLVKEGVTSLKLYLAYKDRLQVDDATLFKTLMKAAEAGMLVLVHAESGDAIDIMIQEALAKGHLSTEWHALTRPPWTEAEATMRAVALAGLAGATLYVVHMTCEESVDQLTYGREHGLRVMGETCTHYLFFTVDELRRPDGAKYVCTPPFRTRHDNEFLWKALANNRLQAVSTDHCPFMYQGDKEIEYEGQPYQMAGKELGAGNFAKIPNGAPGIEHRQMLLWTYGVEQSRISANRFVELTATNPAKIFGLYPRKGTLAVGSDADVVIWNPNVKKVVSLQNSHQRLDYNLYEGREVIGAPEKVYVRGKLIVDGESWRGQPGQGSFIPRHAHAPVL
jgi:dihydropyrimidinase